MGSLSSTISQMFPPKPEFTEKSLPSLQGKVYIVTGSSSGIGKEVAQILYSKHATVYIAARSSEKSQAAIKSIKTAFPDSKGSLVFLHLDLNDLTTIKASAQTFLSKETKLHILFNNAGVMTPPQGSKTAQGYELQLGTNNLAPFLFTKLLTPILISTATSEPPNTVRVVWVSSSGIELGAPKGGIDISNLNYHKDESPTTKYCISKAGNYFHAVEFARWYKDKGIVSVALNPGNLNTDLARYKSKLFVMAIKWMIHPPVYGAYTEIFAGFSGDVSNEMKGDWVVPWGRIYRIRKDVAESAKRKEDGGTGVGLKFWEWTEEQIKPYL